MKCFFEYFSRLQSFDHREASRLSSWVAIHPHANRTVPPFARVGPQEIVGLMKGLWRSHHDPLRWPVGLIFWKGGYYVGLTFRVSMCHFDTWGLFGSLKCFKCSPPLSWRTCVLASFSWANENRFCVESFNRDPDFVNGFWLGVSPPKLNMDPKNDGWNHWNLLLQGAPIFRCYVGIVYSFCAKITQIQPWTHDGTHDAKKTDSQHPAGRREIHKPFWTQLTSSDCGLRISSEYPFISSKNQHRWESLWRCP